MIDNTPNYDEEKKQAIQKNLKHIELNLETSKEYKIKIKKWCEKFNFNFDEVIKKAKTDKIFRAVFAKDPLK